LVHGLLSLQLTALPKQLPLLQASWVVQALPSLHCAVTGVATQSPVLASQAVLVHGLLSLQPTGTPGWQTPVAHFSPVVHRLPSSHAVPESWPITHLPALQVSLVQLFLSSQSLFCAQFPPQPLIGAWAHWPCEHESAVQGLPSSQLTAVPEQTPALQISPPVHVLLSVQTAPLAAVNVQPWNCEQASVVHGLLSLHTTAVPLQTPATQVSLLVQTLLSPH
jgi:hypothetical protein